MSTLSWIPKIFMDLWPKGHILSGPQSYPGEPTVLPMVKITQAELYSSGNHFDFRAGAWSTSLVSSYPSLPPLGQDLIANSHVANRKPRKVLGTRPLFLAPLPRLCCKHMPSLLITRKEFGGFRVERTDLASRVRVSGLLTKQATFLTIFIPFQSPLDTSPYWSTPWMLWEERMNPCPSSC